MLPVGRNMVVADLDAGVVYFFAVSAAMELSIFMAGWSSRNKYSLLGAMRAVAQMISYEVPLILSSVAVIMTAGSLSTVTIVERQAGYSGFWPHWYVLTPWGLAGFILFMIAATAESNRSPFDLPEGESEIIAGYFTEYSGFKFALFFLGEYLGMFAISGLGITLFLGGWSAPFSFLTWVPSWIWFFAQTAGADRDLYLGARNASAAEDGPVDELRVEIHAADGAGGDSLRGYVALSAGRRAALGDLRCRRLRSLYVLLGRSLTGGQKLEKRIYRFAE